MIFYFHFTGMKYKVGIVIVCSIVRVCAGVGVVCVCGGELPLNKKKAGEIANCWI